MQSVYRRIYEFGSPQGLRCGMKYILPTCSLGAGMSVYLYKKRIGTKYKYTHKHRYFGREAMRLDVGSCVYGMCDVFCYCTLSL